MTDTITGPVPSEDPSAATTSSSPTSPAARHARFVSLVAITWGFFLPIEFVRNVPGVVMHALHYGPILLLVLLAPDDLAPVVRRRIFALGGLIAAFGLVRIAMGHLNGDPNGRYLGVVAVVSMVACVPLALRTVLHQPILVGFLAGTTASAVVCIMQAMSIPTLRDGNENGKRFPGLSTYTMLLTWQLVFAILIAVFLLVRLERGRPGWWAAAFSIPVCSVALLANGAQGGFLGAAAAIAAVAWWSRNRGPGRFPARVCAIAAVGLVALVGAFVVVADVSVPTIEGFVGEGDYVNEKARFNVARTGWDEMVANPVRGIGRQQFIDKHVIAPHFLPLEAGATAGVLAGAMAVGILLLTYRQLLRRPAPGAYAMFGMALLAAQCSNTLTEASGPFIGVSHAILLFVSIVAAQVGDDPASPGLTRPAPTLYEQLASRRSTTRTAPTTPPR